ncbi:MAG: FHA domain-containing protein, partial [Myxococcales bacterium]
MAELVFFRRFEELMRVSLDGRPLTVGRGPINDILVPDPAVSRQQFVLERGEAGWRLRDLSGKGTEIGGVPVPEFALTDGADIGLGQWRAVFSLSRREAESAEATQVTGQVRNTLVQPGTVDDGRVLPAKLRLRGEAGERTVPIGAELTTGR